MSTNGTFLNGNKIVANSERELRFGDTIGVGVSHFGTDTDLPVTDDQFFIYSFQKVNIHEQRTERVENDDDDDDIQFVGEFESPGSGDGPAAAANGESSPSPVKNFKKTMPPPPPPPIISKPNKTKNSAQSTATSGSSEGASATSSSAKLTVDENGNENSSSKHDGRSVSSREVTPSSSRRISVSSEEQNQDREEPSRKRAKRMISSSSDDSSDGLGEVTYPSKKSTDSKSAVKYVPETYSGVSTDESSYEEDDVSNEAEGSPKWVSKTKSKPDHAHPDSPRKVHHKSRPVTKSKSPQKTARKRTSPLPKKIIEKRKREKEKELLTRAALLGNNLCSVNLKNIITLKKDGKFVVAKSVIRKYSKETVRRIERDYRASLVRMGKIHRKPSATSQRNTESDSDLSREQKKKKNQQQQRVYSVVTSSDEEDLFEPINPRDRNHRISRKTSESDQEGNQRDVRRSTSPEAIADDDHPPSDNDYDTSSSPEPPPESTKPAPQTNDSKPPLSNRRSIQVLDTAPLPMFAQKAQIRAGAFKPPAPKKNTVKTYGGATEREYQFLTTEEQKQKRIQKLKDVEMRKQKEKEEQSREDHTKPKQAATAKIKYTPRNRGLGLLATMMGKQDFDDNESVIGGDPRPKPSAPTSKNNSVEPERNTDATFKEPEITFKEPEITFKEPEIIRDPRLLARRVEQDIHNSMKKTFPHQPSAAAQRPPPPVLPQPSRPPARAPPPPPPTFLKPGAQVIFSPPMGIGKPIKTDSNSSLKSVARKMTPKPLKSDDEIYKVLGLWRPNWAEEQKFMPQEPPIVPKDLSITMTLTSYNNFQAYFETYYPLLLLEIWASLCKDKERVRNNEGTNFHRTTDYRIKVDDLKRPGFCYLIKHKAQSRDVSKDETWALLSYHSWTRNINEIDSKRDFVSLTVSGTEKYSNTKISKTLFGFSVPNSERYDLVDGQRMDCDPRIVEKPNQKGRGYRFTETLVSYSQPILALSYPIWSTKLLKFGSHFEIDAKAIGQVTRLCYLHTKIREFRALNELQSSKLFDLIVSPPKEVKNPWKAMSGNAHTSKNDYNLIALAQKLNPEQQSMLQHISRRVFSNEPELMLMHGPPGTGKTTTLVALVLQLLLDSQKVARFTENRRILVCTPSNAAIDEIMRRLIDAVSKLPDSKEKLFIICKKLNIVRIGDGYSREFENYSINAKVKQKEEEKSTVQSIKVELTALENEIEDAKTELNTQKNVGGDPIIISAKAAYLRDLELKRECLLTDLNPSRKKANPKDVNDNKRQEVIRDAHIICSTLSSSSNSLIRNAFMKTTQSDLKPFMCCIVDEASQTTETETLLPLQANVDKLLLVGDPEQLGATVLSSTAESKGYGQSLFTRLYKFYTRQKVNPVMMLRRQYRMHPDIVKWPNSYCYEGKLISCYQSPANPSFPLIPYQFINMSAGKEHSEREGCSFTTQRENNGEVLMVKALLDILEDILGSHSQSAWTVGIITPYAAQKHGIMKQLQNKKYRGLNRVEVDTVDGFQGQERDIVILSCVRTDGTGFLKSKNRLNVALTRAKHALYIIGDARCLSQDDMWNCLIKDCASRQSCKFEVQPNFQLSLGVLKSELAQRLKKPSR